MRERERERARVPYVLKQEKKIDVANLQIKAPLTSNGSPFQL